MAITEGVGIVAAGKEARAKALAKSKQVTSDKKIAAEYKVDPFDKILRDIDKGFDRIRSQESTGGTKERGRGMGDTFDPSKDFSVKKPSFFSPGGGIYDSRNEVKVASTDLSGLTSDEKTTSTFGTSFTEQASANLADASIYKKKEDNIYRPTDSVYDSVKFPKIEKDTGYGASLEKSIDNLDSFNKSFYNVDKATKEYGVPMSKEEKRVTTAYALTNPDESFKDAYKFSDTNYAKYQNLRDRRQTRKEAEEAVNKFRSDAYKDFERADYAIKMTQYNPDGTEKDINRYNQTLDERRADIKRLNRTNEDLVDIMKRYPKEFKENFNEGLYGLSRFGRIIPQKDIDAYEKKVAAEEAERIRLSKEKAKKDYEDSQKNIFQKVGDFIGRVTRPPAALGAENPLSRTVPSGSFNISQEGKDQAAINRGVAAAAKTGIPSGADLKAGSFGISQEGKDQAAINRGIKAAEATGIPSGDALKAGSFGISKAGAEQAAKNRAEAKSKAQAAKKASTVSTTTKQGKPRTSAQMAAAKRKATGRTVSQAKAANKAAVRKAASERQAAFKKTGKSTASARKAAAKASVKAAAKKRHAAFKKRRKARKKSKKGKK